jgi:ribosomal-protein-alanine N-acetyltransferase
MIIRGPRLQLRHGRPDDAAALFELGRDPEVTRWFSWGPYAEPSEPLEFIDRMAAARESGERLEFVIAGPDDEPLGITGLSELSLRDRRAVVGTWLGRQHWGTGVNREAKALILAFAFRGLGLMRVSAHAHPQNVRSLRALEQMGFVREGVLVAWHVHGDERRDVVILRLLREDWERSELASVPVTLEDEPKARTSAGKRVQQ